MAALGQKFDASSVDTEQRDYAELPNGTYILEMTAGDVVATKDGKGTLLKTTFDVIEPEQFKGRKLFNNYNLVNGSAEAQRIGLQQFASLCRAVGVSEVEDSDELLFKSFTAKIGLGKPSKDGQYPARAEIKTYYFPDAGNVPEPSIDAGQAPAPANDNRAPAANDNRQAQQAAAAPKKNPWSKG